MDGNNYIAQRLSAIGSNYTGNSELEALKVENARLKQQLEQIPTTNFKSEVQTAFEQSAEFESILNAFYLRFIRDKFNAEFKNSIYIKAFQETANHAFEKFEKNFKKEVPKNASQDSNGKKANGNGNAGDRNDDGENDTGKGA